MKTKWGISCMLGLAVILAAGANDALAVAQRTFVASFGSPANTTFNCSIANPCRGFSEAISVTSPGGEVIVLDSAGYGTVTISQAVSIIAPPGVYAGVSVFSGTGIVVNAGTSNVTLSGLTLNGLGGGTGIDFQSAGILRLEQMTIRGFTGNGLGGALAAATTLIVRNSTFVSNGFAGLIIGTSAGVVTFDIEGSTFDGNTHGAAFTDNVAGTVSGSSFNKNGGAGNFVQPQNTGTTANMTFRNCVFSGNNYGFISGLLAGATVTVQLTDSELSDNATFGLSSQAGSTTNVSNSTLTRNGTGIANFGGTARSFTDNRLYGNGADGVFSSTIAKQ